jgi:hypothetical protein
MRDGVTGDWLAAAEKARLDMAFYFSHILPMGQSYWQILVLSLGPDMAVLTVDIENSSERQDRTTKKMKKKPPHRLLESRKGY